MAKNSRGIRSTVSHRPDPPGSAAIEATVLLQRDCANKRRMRSFRAFWGTTQCATLSQLDRGWKDIHRRRLSEGAKQFADALGNQMRLTVKALGRGLISARYRPDAYLSVAAACALIAGISLGAPDAAAQTSAVKSVFENYKLFGIFGFDCSKPASGENYYYVHRMIDPDHAERD